jgi:hypothetical protein
MNDRNTKVFIPPKFEDTKSPDYRYIYSTGVFGALDPNDGRIIFYVDRMEPETVNEPKPGAMKLKKIVRELQMEVHMTPTQFKNLAHWMMNNIKRYEEVFGEIPMAPKQSGKRPPPDTMVT